MQLGLYTFGNTARDPVTGEPATSAQATRDLLEAIQLADQVGLGLPLDAASTLLGPRTLGHHFAFELLVAGEPFDAARAHQAGLVNKIVAPGMVEEAARTIAEQIALRPPEAVRLAKRMMVGDRRDAVTRITSEASSFAALQNSPHASAALQERLKRGGF